MIKKNLFIFIYFFCLLFSFELSALLKVDVDVGSVKPVSVAIVERCQKFIKDSNVDVSQVIGSNLSGTGLFSFFDYSCSDDLEFDAEKYSKSDVSVVILVSYELFQDDLELTYSIWDLGVKKLLSNKTIRTKLRNWRGLAHAVSNDVYKYFIGENGYFHTKIVYIESAGDFNNPSKRVVVMDQDGCNQRYVTDGKYLVAKPTFAVGAKSVAYVSYADVTPKVYLHDLVSGNSHVVGGFENMTSAPSFSPKDKNILAISVMEEYATNIYIINLKDGSKRKLTNDGSINTTPHFSPNGKKIVFSSDRSGSQQLYTINTDGTSLKRISFGSNAFYAAPVFSPNGRNIAFIKKEDNEFYLGVMDKNGGNERMLTKGYLLDSPSWSPTARYVLVTRENKDSKKGKVFSEIVSVDITGRYENVLNTGCNASEACWSLD